MDLIIKDSQLNHLWWNSGHCPTIHLLEHELISRPRGVSLDRCISTKCHITAEVLWYCLTGKILPEGLVFQDQPTAETLYINCNFDEHVFILHQGKIYDSCWNIYSLTVREAPSEMIRNIKEYKPFILPQPDGSLYEVSDYDCYSSDTNITDDRIICNYKMLKNNINR
jgi:hypothetical protein